MYGRAVFTVRIELATAGVLAEIHLIFWKATVYGMGLMTCYMQAISLAAHADWVEKGMHSHLHTKK